MGKVLLTGATGYIGGQALHNIFQAKPIQITVLIRNAGNEAAITQQYPGVRVVIGDLDDVDLIEKLASDADVVFHLASTKHLPSSQAISRGLVTRSNSGPEARPTSGPSYWVQISGASMFSGQDIANDTYGEPSSKVYNDLHDTEEIRSVITSQPARTVDNLVLQQDPSKVRTALIIGPLFYGEGQGPVNQRSIQAPELARLTIQEGQGFHVGAGKSAWSDVHVRDLGSLFQRLYEAALANKLDVWNENGVYAVESGVMPFGELSARIAKDAQSQGFINSAEVKTITPDEMDKMLPHGAILLGTNAVLKAERARAQLNWRPTHPNLADTISDTVRVEGQNLQSQ